MDDTKKYEIQEKLSQISKISKKLSKNLNGRQKSTVV